MIVGLSDTSSGPEAFLWDSANGIRNLKDVLVSDCGLGASLAGWTLTFARDISADGTAIVGFGTNPSGDSEAWLAVIPEPTSFALAVIGMLGVVIGRKEGNAVTDNFSVN